jgi:hypothetical protein
MADVPHKETLRLIHGNRLRCPNCEVLGDPFRDFKPLQYVEKYERELNRVLRHRRDRGGCGHVFSPGDPWIIQKYLAGELVQVELLNQSREHAKQLEEELQQLRHELVATS